MLDTQGHVVAATAANLFVRRNGQWLTPPVEDCGIAGVARRWLISEIDASEAQLSVGAVESADVCVLTNALRGPRQVGQLAQQRWEVDGQVQALQVRWQALFANEADR